MPYDCIEKKREYNQRPDVKEKKAVYMKEYNQRPESKIKRKEAKRIYRQKIRDEIWGTSPFASEQKY